MSLNFYFVIPNNINQISGGSIYDRMLIEQLKNRNHKVIVHEIKGTFPRENKLNKKIPSVIENILTLKKPTTVIVDGITILGFEITDFKNLIQLNHQIIIIVHLPINIREHPVYSQYSKEEFDKERKLYHLATNLIVPSKKAKKLIINHFDVNPIKIEIIAPGKIPSISVEKSKPENNIVKLLCIANFVPNKGYLELFKGLTYTKNSNWKLMCIGKKDVNKSYYEACKKFRDNHGLENKIKFIDPVPYESLGKYYREADIYINTSKFETYGMATSDAFAYGLPVITTKVGKLPPNTDDFLTVYADDPQSIANAVDKLFNIQKRKNLAKRSLKYGKSLSSWSNACEKLLEAVKSDQDLDDEPKFNDWLKIRYPYDIRARNQEIQNQIIDRLNIIKFKEALIIDVGAGLGANTRHFASLLDQDQIHILIDNDPDLLTSSITYLDLSLKEGGWKKISNLQKSRLDTYRLSNQKLIQEKKDEILMYSKQNKRNDQNTQYLYIIHQEASLLNLPVDIISSDFDLILANAVFDLFSKGQFEDFLTQFQPSLFYLTLNYEKTLIHSDLLPPRTNYFLDLYDKHMQRPQNFGKAMGKKGPQLMEEVFHNNEYKVITGSSHWRLDYSDKEIMLMLVKFMKNSIPEVLESTKISEFEEWAEKIKDLILKNIVKMTIEHKDILAYPQII